MWLCCLLGSQSCVVVARGWLMSGLSGVDGQSGAVALESMIVEQGGPVSQCQTACLLQLSL
jgi:hypothetical protein